MIGTSLDEMTKHEDRARNDLLVHGQKIGNAIRDGLDEFPVEAHLRVAQQIIALIDEGVIHQNLAQGVWYGLDVDTPISQLREVNL